MTYKNRCVHHLFEEAVEKHSQRIAVRYLDEFYTYQQLNEKANQLAHFLLQKGIQVGDRVALLLNRSPEMVFSMIATAKSGAAYVPLRLDYPQQRIQHILNDTESRCILTVRKFLPNIPQTAIPIYCLDDALVWEKCPSTNPALPNITPKHVFYIPYSSGTTGLPKGVLVPHRAIPGFLFCDQHAQYDEQVVLLQINNYSWDVTIREFWSALLFGGALVLYPYDQFDPEKIAAEAKRTRVNTMWLPAAMLNILLDTVPNMFASFRLVMSGGDRASVNHYRLFKQMHPQVNLIQTYGPTECTGSSSIYLVENVPAEMDSIPLGTGMGDRVVYVLDEQLQPVKGDEIGEVYISGDCVALGYLNNPALTAEKFLPDPFQPGTDARMYATGDLARRGSDGLLRFVSRKDYQVKIRGYRVEPDEVASVLNQHPQVKQSIVLAKDDGFGQKYLAAYLIPTQGHLSAGEIKAHLEQILPPYMIPETYHSLLSFPLTPNGKIDRKTLAEIDTRQIPSDATEEPEGTRAYLRKLWMQATHVDSIQDDENFFALGGNSLMAVRVVAEINRRFNTELPLAALYEMPTIAALATCISPNSRPTDHPALPAEQPTEYPLAAAQKGMWYLQSVRPDLPIYNITAELEYHGQVDARLLRRALEILAHRHAMLRTHLASRPSETVWMEESAAPIAWNEQTFVDWAAYRSFIQSQAHQPIDLFRLPIFQFHLSHLPDKTHRLFLITHHLLVDGLGLRILARDLNRIYAALVEGNQPSPSATSKPYAVFVLDEHYADCHCDYWQEKLAGRDLLVDIPTDLPRPLQLTHRGGRLNLDLGGANFVAAIRALAKANAQTPYTILLAAIMVLLRRYSNQNEITLGTAVDNRSFDFEGTIGHFVNTLVLNSHLEDQTPFVELARQLQQDLLQALEHQVPFDDVVRRVNPVRIPNRQPLYDIGFSFIEQDIDDEPVCDGLVLHRLYSDEVDTGTSRFDLVITVKMADSFSRISLEYNQDVFTELRMARMVDHLREILCHVTETPSQPVSRINLLTAPERNLHQQRMAGGLLGNSEKTVISEFRAIAAQQPDKVALIFGDQRLTYGEVDRRTNQLANFLLTQHYSRGALIAIYQDRNLDFILSSLAVLKAGLAFLPLDPNSPAERIGFILSDSQVQGVLTTRQRSALITESQPLHLCLDEIPWQQCSDQYVDRGIQGQDFAYSIYTSGSTGKPKGCGITHHNFINLFLGLHQQKTFDFSEDHIWACSHSLAFDFSLWEIWNALLSKAAVVLIPREVAVDPEKMCALLVREKVTTLNQTPSAFRELVAYERNNFDRPIIVDLRQILIGAEAFDVPSVQQWYELHGNQARLYNIYGITETTMVNTATPVLPEHLTNGKGPDLGLPYPNSALYLLDDQMQPVVDGVVGEIYLGGDCVGMGYLFREDLTREKYLPDPFIGQGRAVMYKSGDLARYDMDGKLYYVGRNDNQVKLRGLRIEIGEIENALKAHPAVAFTAVVVNKEKAQIIAYLVLKDPAAKPSYQELSSFLSQKVQPYMVPSTYVVIDKLPININGKLDYRNLPPATEQNTIQPASDDSAASQPTTPLEQLIALIWCEKLGLNDIGLDDNFFTVGGHSILVIRANNQLEEIYDIKVPLSVYFSGGTIRALVQYLAAQFDLDDLNAVAEQVLALLSE